MPSFAATTSVDVASLAEQVRVLPLGPGERGVFVRREGRGFAYHANPALVSVDAPWPAQVARYPLVDPNSVAAHLAPGSGLGGLVGSVLTGVGTAAVIALRAEALVPALAAGAVVGAALGAVARRGKDHAVLAYDPGDAAGRAFVRRIELAAAGLTQSSVLRGALTSPGVTAPSGELAIDASDRCALPFVLNVACPCWRLGRAQVLFLPDRVAVLAGGGTTFHPYEGASVEQGTADIAESGAPPPDASVLSAGVVRYGRIRLRMEGGFELVIEASNNNTAAVAGALLHEALRSSPDRLASLPPPPTPSRVPPPSPSFAPPSPSPLPSFAPPPPSPSPSFVPPPPSRSLAPSPPLPPSKPPPSPPRASVMPEVSTATSRPPPPAALAASFGPPLRASAPPAPPVHDESPQLVALREAARSFVVPRPSAPPSRPAAPPVPSAPPSRPAPSSRPSGRWLAAGESVEVAGFRLPGGLLYVGERRPAGFERDEPSLIRPGLEVSRDFDRAGASMGYWPTYSGISAACRGTYLRWLAEGRRDPDIGAGYVFLFFYGLERRVLDDRSVTPEDLAAVHAEVLALRAAYPAHASFQRYASSLLDALSLKSPACRRSAPEPSVFSGEELPFWLRLEVSLRAKEQRPLDAPWALAWLDAARPSPSPTVRSRCAPEVEALFAIRYREAFGEGVVPARWRAGLSFTYRGASEALREMSPIDLGDLTDATRGASAEKRLDEIAAVLQRCVDELDPYSRWLGRTPHGRATVAALAWVPPALAAVRPSDVQKRFVDQLRTRLGDRACVALPARELLDLMATNSVAKLSRGDATLVLRALGGAGFGVEPDLRFRAPVLSASGDVVIFRLSPDAPTEPTREYEAATLFAQLAAMMSTADGDVGADERAHFERHVEEALHLSAPERARLGAHLEWLLRAPPTSAAIKKRLAGVAPAGRQMLASFLVGVAGADGRIDPAEVKLLRKLYPLLGLEPDLVYSHVHAMAATSPSIVPPPPPSGRRSAPPPPGPVRLDMDRVQATLSQTAAVAELLGSIFEEPEAPTATAGGRSLAGLDAAHSSLLLALAKKPRWSRADFEREARALGLMPDGALEILNDRACDRCGAPLCDGDDPIDVDPDVAKEMTDA